MSRLRPEKLHVRFAGSAAPEGPLTPRRYTLTHSDTTGDLFLTVGPAYDKDQISGWYTRLMRDEVLAEWREEADGPALHVYCHLSGGLVVGTAGWRYAIFQRELPLVLAAFLACILYRLCYNGRLNHWMAGGIKWTAWSRTKAARLLADPGNSA